MKKFVKNILISLLLGVTLFVLGVFDDLNNKFSWISLIALIVFIVFSFINFLKEYKNSK